MQENHYPSHEELNAKIDMLLIAIDNTNKRIDDLRDNINRTFTVFGIAIGLFAVLLAGLQVAIVFLH